MIERASMDVHTFNPAAPGPAQRFAEKPATMSLPGKPGHEANERELTLTRLSIV